MTTLVIVESEAKAKTLLDQTGGAHEVLLLRSIPMKISHNPKEPKLYTGESGFQFVPTDSEKEFARTVLTSLDKDICLALDSDQRGEFWSWLVAKFLFFATKGQKPARRIRISGFAEQEIASSFQMDDQVDDARATAYYIRSLFDGCLVGHIRRLIGTESGPGGIPLYFSSLTALFCLEDREAGIAAFAAPPKWRIKVRLSGSKGDFMAHVNEVREICQDGFFRDPEEVKKAVALFENKPSVVNKIEETDFTLEPPSPYGLAELLHDGYTLLGMGPAKVLLSVQKFYGGIEINGRSTGLTTTPFAQSSDGSDLTLLRVRTEVVRLYGSSEMVERDVEGGILPLLPGLTGSELPDSLSVEEKNLYELIRCRALAGQMGDACGRNLLVECVSGGCLFAGRGIVLDEKGFLRVFQAGYDPDLLRESPLADLAEGQQLAVGKIIPEQSGSGADEYYTFETFFDDLRDFSMEAEASMVILIQQMLDKNYLSIDGNGCFHMQDNGRKVTATLNRAFPSMKGINLSAYFEQTVNEVVSGRKALDFALKQFDQNFAMHGVPLVKTQAQAPKAVPIPQQRSRNIIKTPVQAEVRAGGSAATEHAPGGEARAVPEVDLRKDIVPDEAENLREQEEDREEIRRADETGVKPEVSSEQGSEDDDRKPVDETDVVAEGQAGEDSSFLENAEVEESPAAETTAAAAMMTPPEAKEQEQSQEENEAVFSESPAGVDAVGQDVTEPEAEGKSERICPACGRHLLLKSDRFGKYWACAGYPSCRHSESFEGAKQEEIDPLCPVCGKESVSVKRTPTGKKLYVCSTENCEFMAWSQPHAIDCPSCGSPFLVEKKSSLGHMVLRCPRAGCSYSQPLDDAPENETEDEQSLPGKKKKILVRRKTGSASGSGTKKKVVVRRVKR
ncbi:MAG: DNA topoisomerase [Pseudomonadota bacterium]